MKNEVVFSYDENESAVSLELTDKIIEEFGIEKGKTFDRDQFDALKDLEQVSRAYNKALKYLTVKDYTYHQMRKKLMDKGDYDDTQLDATLDLLCEKNLINDELYSINYLKRCSRLGIGINKAIYNLRNYGVDSEVIDHCLDELDDEEYQAATHLIDSYFKKNSTNSFKNIQKRIKEKLYIKGFTIDTIEKAMSDYDFIYDDEKEKQTLEKEIDKIYKRYSMKLNSKELKNKLIDTLLRKGYNYDDIKSVLISKENDNE